MTNQASTSVPVKNVLSNSSFSNNRSVRCFRCGNSADHVANFKNCPAKNAKCRFCSKVGHFQSQCKTRANVRSIELPTNDVHDDASGDVEIEEATIFSVGSGSKRCAYLEGIPITTVIDTGAKVSKVPSQGRKLVS